MAVHTGKLVLVLLVALFVPRATADSLQRVVTVREQERLKQLLLADSNWNDLHTSYLAIKGLESLGTAIPRELARKACSSIGTPEDLESIFYASSLSKILGDNCKVTISGVESKLKEHLSEGATVTTLYYAALSLHNFNIAFDKAQVLSLLTDALDSDDMPLSAGMGFKVAAILHAEEVDVSAIFDSIEDVINQADEADTTLNFDSGLTVTTVVIVGAFELSTAIGKAPVISEEHMIKLGNYFVVNCHTGLIKDASYVSQAIGSLGKNQFFRPTALLLENNRPITASNPDLKVRFTDILDQPLGKATVKATSIDDPDGENVLTKNQFTVDSDGITYSIPLYPNVVQPGVYNVQLSAILQGDSAMFDIPDATMKVTVSQTVAVKDTKLSIIDREQGVATKELKLQYPDPVKDSLSADFHQNVHMSFIIVGNMHKKPIKVHQAFVMMKKKQQEVFFVATPDKENHYTFELDVNSAGKDSFGYMSGTYEMSLIIGDFAAENPFVWKIGSITLKFSSEPPAKKPKESRLPKPVIEHMFRPPDKRASQTMSTTFTVLTLLPILLLLAVVLANFTSVTKVWHAGKNNNKTLRHLIDLATYWFGLGANISNLFDSGLWGVLFQLGLIGIFSLFFCFWLQLNMFQTLWYLGLLGSFTFFAGNRMLRVKAAASQKKT